MIVEAAMIFPLILLLTLALLYWSVELYQQVCFSCVAHQTLRRVGGELTGTVEEGERGPELPDQEELEEERLEQLFQEKLEASPMEPQAERISTEKRGGIPFSRLEIRLEKRTGGTWLFSQRGSFRLESEQALQDEGMLLRKSQLVIEGVEWLGKESG